MMKLNPIDEHYCVFGELTDENGELYTAQLEDNFDQPAAPWFTLEQGFPEVGRDDIFIVTKNGEDEYLMRAALDNARNFTSTSTKNSISHEMIKCWTYAEDSMSLFFDGRMNDILASENCAYPKRENK